MSSSPSFTREGLRTSVVSVASGESFSSVSGTDTLDDSETAAAATKPRSTSLSALGVNNFLIHSVLITYRICELVSQVGSRSNFLLAKLRKNNLSFQNSFLLKLKKYNFRIGLCDDHISLQLN